MGSCCSVTCRAASVPQRWVGSPSQHLPTPSLQLLPGVVLRGPAGTRGPHADRRHVCVQHTAFDWWVLGAGWWEVEPGLAAVSCVCAACALGCGVWRELAGPQCRLPLLPAAAGAAHARCASWSPSPPTPSSSQLLTAMLPSFALSPACRRPAAAKDGRWPAAIGTSRSRSLPDLPTSSTSAAAAAARTQLPPLPPDAAAGAAAAAAAAAGDDGQPLSLQQQQGQQQGQQGQQGLGSPSIDAGGVGDGGSAAQRLADSNRWQGQQQQQQQGSQQQQGQQGAPPPLRLSPSVDMLQASPVSGGAGSGGGASGGGGSQVPAGSGLGMRHHASFSSLRSSISGAWQQPALPFPAEQPFPLACWPRCCLLPHCSRACCSCCCWLLLAQLWSLLLLLPSLCTHTCPSRRPGPHTLDNCLSHTIQSSPPSSSHPHSPSLPPPPSLLHPTTRCRGVARRRGGRRRPLPLWPSG